MILKYCDKFKHEANGETYWQGDGTMEYETALEFMAHTAFGFCGCGEPEKTLPVIKNYFNMLYQWESRLENNKKKKITWDDIVKECFSGRDDLAYITAYALHNAHLTTHGGSVNYSWLTDLGQDILHDLNALMGKEQ
jgi:hypothetical protein